MENKLLLRFSIIIALLGFIFAGITLKYTFELEKNLKQKDEILDKVLLKDSLLQKSKKVYSEKIDKYVQDCQYIIDGKMVGSDELVKLIQELYLTEKQNADSLYYYKEHYKSDANTKEKLYKAALNGVSCNDSLQVYKSLAGYIKKTYGINDKVYIQDNELKISRSFNRADSAAAVFKFYKHTLHKDKNGNWIVGIPPDNPVK